MWFIVVLGDLKRVVFLGISGPQYKNRSYGPAIHGTRLFLKTRWLALTSDQQKRDTVPQRYSKFNFESKMLANMLVSHVKLYQHLNNDENVGEMLAKAPNIIEHVQ